MMRALLMGPAVHPFRDGLEKMVTTPWEFVEVGFAMDDPALMREIATADAAISVSWGWKATTPTGTVAYASAVLATALAWATRVCVASATSTGAGAGGAETAVGTAVVSRLMPIT